MATYKYQGFTAKGVQQEGIVKAVNEAEAIIQIRKTVETITSLKAIEESPDLFANIGKKKVDIKSLSLICQQFSIILHAGLPLTTSIRLVGHQTEDANLKKLLEGVGEDVTGGSGIADSFEARDPSLPTTFVETIRAGEASGKLDVAFERLAIYFTKRSKTSGKVKSALIYPIIVIVIAVIVVGVLMVVAVPKFMESFTELGVDLPGVTKALIAMSNFFVNWTWALLIFIALVYLGYRIYISRDKGRYHIASLKLKMPLLGKIRSMSSASEFANSFATMLAAGIPAIKALYITGKSISNYSVSEDVIRACTLVEGGYKIADSLKETTNLPDLLIEVIGVGENSGSLENTLSVISEFYDNEVDTSTANALAVLEPGLIIVLAVIVVFILLAVYLPMFSMYGNL